MKWLFHVGSMIFFLVLVYFLYNRGLGVIPFSLAALYFGVISISEYRRMKKEKR